MPEAGGHMADEPQTRYDIPDSIKEGGSLMRSG